MTESLQPQPVPRPPSDAELLSTLFELGREVTSVLDLEELLEKIPQLIARLTHFNAFSVYLLDASRSGLEVAYSVGFESPAYFSKCFKEAFGYTPTSFSAS